MRWFLSLFLLGAAGAAFSQQASSDLHRVEHFEILERSRLVALAKLGAATKTSLLVEGGDIRFLEQSITLSADRQTVDELILKILRGREHYATTHRGVLIVAYPTRPSKPINRILKLPLGPFSFDGKSISSLDPLISFYIRRATGCRPQGYMWVGPPLHLDIPRFTLKSATFERIVEQVAKAPEPTMWTVMPNAGDRGCIDDPESLWEVGFYDYGLNGNPMTFRGSSGPQVVK
jgi:hypothetical protein